jgi:uncharacterized protein (TIGR04255 family)
MQEPRHYRNPPIREAIIDLRISARPELQIEELRAAHDGEERRYPHTESIYHTVGQLELKFGESATASASAQQHHVGFKFSDSDGRYVWQSRVDGLTVSRLVPYADWATFRDEARRIWTLYRDRVHPVSIDRLAVRYINRFDLPEAVVDLKRYFRTSPEVSPELPQALSGFFMQLRIEDEPGLEALISQAVVPPPREGTASVVLDIDLFARKDIPQDEEGLWKFFERLRSEKNRIFEACITDDARRLFDPCT